MTNFSDECFKKGIPSVFVLGSPFQVICAIAAIHNLEIEDYKIILFRSFTQRDRQMEQVLKEENIEYSIAPSDKITWRLYRFLAIFPFINKYKRLFIGYHREAHLHYIGLIHVSCFSDIIYLDDGSESISLFLSQSKRNYLGLDYHFLKCISFVRKINFGRYFYSVYAGIKNPNYDIIENKLTNLHDVKKIKNNDGIVYIVGTVQNEFCRNFGISLDMFYYFLHRLFEFLRKEYVEAHIVYVPHGRVDNDFQVREICDKSQVEYKEIDTTVEMEVLKQSVIPHVICGFTSSALFSIKKLFPTVDVYNFVCDYNKTLTTYLAYDSISDYYSENGITRFDFSRFMP